MRKRSEVRAAAMQQQTIDDAGGPGQASKAAANMILCPREGCGTRMSAQAAKDNDGECVRCAAKLPGFGGEPAAEGVVKARALTPEPDPWELTPEGQRKADAERAAEKKPQGDVVTGTAEETLAVLSKRLENRGYRVSLVEIASWTPEQRAQASQLIEGGFQSVPSWLAKHRDESLALGKHVRVTAEGPDVKYEPPPGSQAAAGMFPVEPQTVSYCWAEEKITPIKGSFSTCSVGPFSMTTNVRRGETPSQAYQWIAAEVTAMAEQERERKLQSFIRKLTQVAEQVSKAGA